MSAMKLCRISLRAFLPRTCSSRCTLPPSLRTYTSMHAFELDSALGCNIYISEGRDKDIIRRLQAEASATEGVALANVFVDAPYNRTGFTFVSTHADKLTTAVVRLSRASLQLLDLRSHAATHPRLGVVDHISLHPLGSLVRRSAAAHGHHHHHPHPHPSPWPLHPEDHYYHHHHHSQRQQRHGHGHHHHGGGHQQQHHPKHQQEEQQQQQQEQQGAAPATSGGAGGGGHATLWEPPPPGLAGLAVAASCAQYIAWYLSREDDAGEVAAAAAQPGGGGGGPAAAAALEAAPAVPVYLYGYAHPMRRCLSEVRRQLGYFRRAPDGGWGGSNPQLPDNNDLLEFPPDVGPMEALPQSGLVTIGAVPWVVNYNVPLQDVDLEEAKWLARAVSERGGGLPAVEAMALQHADDSVEVACNLLDETVSSPHAVQARLEALASARGLDQWAVLWGYRTNKSPEELLRSAAAAEGAAAWRRGG